ncbi:MAG: ABC transporter ATP-binding protein [Balneolaceae bacterium]
MTSPPILEFNEVTAYRNETKVMDRFSMAVNRLDHTAIVGPNGSGKSTFIQLLTHQLYPIHSGNGVPPIRVFGKDRWNVGELRRRIGIISADLEYEIAHNLRRGRLCGRDVVISGFFSSMQLFGHQRITDKMKQKAERALDSIDASYLSGRMFNRMSAGEARRVLIARALVTSPDMLVLDEPTTALDLVAREKCLRIIRKLARQGTTIFIVTHHLEEVIPEISHVILLKEGKTEFAGHKEKVLTSENLSVVYDHPLTVNRENGRYRVDIE